MTSRRFSSITSKLTLILLTAMVGVLTMTAAAFFISDLSETENRITRQLDPLARQIATQAGASLVFLESTTLQRDLSSLASVANIDAAIVYDLGAARFASFARPAIEQGNWEDRYSQIARVQMTRSATEPGLVVADGFASYLSPVNVKGEPLGYIQLIDNMQESDRQLNRSMLVTLMIMAIATLAALVLARYISHIVTQPIHGLLGSMQAFSASRDYGIRAVKRSDDELGELVDSFNQILVELEKRDLELERYSRGLEHLVDERTRELSEATRRAESANQVKSRFLANISHEIRTPISAIQGLGQLLAGTQVSDGQREWLVEQQQATRHLVHIIDELLDVALIESGRYRVDREVFDLLEMLDSVRAILQRQADEKQLNLVFDVHTALPSWLEGDRRKLMQILLNLLGNSIKFTDQGIVKLSVRAGPAGSEWISLRFVVRDSGIGIKQEDLKMLFEPFSQIDADSQPRRGGLGLGLAISQELAGVMGSRILVESQPGKGSEFSFEVRLKRCNETDQPPFKAVLNRGKASVLLVEDTPLIARIESLLIRSLGLEVTAVESGAEATKALSEGHFDLVLMDVRLPDIDGCTLSRQILESPDWQNTPIVALTAHALASEIVRCRLAGMVDVLTKPLELDQLCRVVREHVIDATLVGRIESSIEATAENTVVWQRLESLRQQLGDRSMRSILEEIIRVLPMAEAEIKTAIRSENIPALRSQVHDLLGITNVWGESPLVTLLRQQSQRPTDKDQLPGFGAELAVEIEKMSRLVLGFLETLPPEKSGVQ